MKALMFALLLLCGSVQAQEIIIVPRPLVVAQPVIVQPAQIVYVPRYGPLNRLFFGPYRVVVIPQPVVIAVPQEKAGK